MRILEVATRPRVFVPLLVLLGLAVSSAYVDRNLPNPDEGAVLTAAAKILRGGVFFRDVDAYPFPGAYYLAAITMAVFGEHLDVARWLAAGVFASLLVCLYATALRLVDRERAALFALSLLAFKFLAWPAFSTYLYSDVAFVFACAAIALLVQPRPPSPARLALAGACTGLALASKQNVGLYLGAAVGTWLLVAGGRAAWAAGAGRPRLGRIGAYGLGVVAVVAPMFAYFASHGLLGTLLYSGFIRPLTGYLPTSGIAFTPMLAWWRLGELEGRTAAPYFVADYWHLLMQEQLPAPSLYPAYWLAGEIVGRAAYTALPAAFLWLAVRWWRHRSDPPGECVEPDEAARPSAQNRLVDFGWLAGSVVLSAFPRADSFHVFSVFPLVWLLLFALLPEGATTASRRRGRTLQIVAVAAVLAVTGALAHTRHAHLTHRVRLARADVRVEPSDAWIEPVVEFVTRRVPEGEPLFVYGHEAHWYFLTGRFFDWPFSQLYPGQAGGDGGRQLAARIAEQRPRVILQGVLSWPGVPELPAYAPDLESAIRAGYKADRRFFARQHVAPPPRWVVEVLRPRTPTGPP